MAFLLAFFATVCIAQGFASVPMLRETDVCTNVASEITNEFEEGMNEWVGLQQLENMFEKGQEKESWNQAVMDACANGRNFQVILYCFREQIPNYIRLDSRMLEMMNNATTELTLRVVATASKYRKLIEVPLKNITDTVRELPNEILTLIVKERDVAKALEAMARAVRIVEDNSRLIGDRLRQMSEEVPSIVEQMEKSAQEIYEEYQRMSAIIKEEFQKCVEEGKQNQLEIEE